MISFLPTLSLSIALTSGHKGGNTGNPRRRG